MHNGAEDGTRTRDIHLGKVALYQLSHFRIFVVRTLSVIGAEDGTRTRDIHLGKVALYQLSHFRILRYIESKASCLVFADYRLVIHPRFELGTP